MASSGESAGMERSDTSPEDLRLRDVLQRLVENRGWMGAATALGVNYRTLVANMKTGRISRRMRQAVQEFEAGIEPDESPDLDGSRGSGGRAETVAQQMETLVGEVGHLAEIVEAQADLLQELGRRVAGLEEVARQGTEENVEPTADEGLPDELHPPEQEQELARGGVVTLEPQPDEERTFGPAAAVLVAEWRKLRGRHRNLKGADRARAEVRLCELMLTLMKKYDLTLPPHTEPLRGPERAAYLRRLGKQLAEAHERFVKAAPRQSLRSR